MKILMTGSTGFIGSRLVPMLEASNYDIFHLVRSKKGFQHEFVWDFSGSLPQNISSCDIVIHLAADVSISSKLNASQYLINSISTAKLVKYCKDKGAFFILASSIAVHENSSHICEKTLIAPKSNYAMSKLLAEEIVKTFLHKAAILRIGGVYGLDGPSHLLLNSAISNAHYQKKAPVLKGLGYDLRNYICVEDVAHWIFCLVRDINEREKSNDIGKVDILYLAGDEVTSIGQYLNTIMEVLLPGEKLVQMEGTESSDCVVKTSPAPFSLTTFREYLVRLKN